MAKITQEELVKEFYLNNPNREIQHEEAVDWLTNEYKKRTGQVFRDPDRSIRKLSQSGFLIKINLVQGLLPVKISQFLRDQPLSFHVNAGKPAKLIFQFQIKTYQNYSS